MGNGSKVCDTSRDQILETAANLIKQAKWSKPGEQIREVRSKLGHKRKYNRFEQRLRNTGRLRTIHQCDGLSSNLI